MTICNLCTNRTGPVKVFVSAVSRKKETRSPSRTLKEFASSVLDAYVMDPANNEEPEAPPREDGSWLNKYISDWDLPQTGLATSSSDGKTEDYDWNFLCTPRVPCSEPKKVRSSPAPEPPTPVAMRPRVHPPIPGPASLRKNSQWGTLSVLVGSLGQKWSGADTTPRFCRSRHSTALGLRCHGASQR